MRLLTLVIVILVLAQICLEVKAAASKDYYKVLGVPKDAGERQIRKAYYKLAQQWHPDRARTDEQRKIHHNKYTDIVKAYETLSDAEKRKKYDMFGDEEQQQGQGGGFKMDPRFSGFGFGSGAQDIKINFGSGGFNFGGFNFGDMFGGAKPRANQQQTKQQYSQKTGSTKSSSGSSRQNCHTQRTCNGGICETRTVCQ
jgi:DnaJ-class molecular chaperone